jgi:cation diffusion facilitator CzcD-associated flavoprotein CzcO
MTSSVVPAVEEGEKIAQSWLGRFFAALEAEDTLAAGAMFRLGGYWRDILALTSDLRTFAGPESISAALKEALTVRKTGHVTSAGRSADVFTRRVFGPTIETFFAFETDIARCRGHLRLLPESGGWKAWTLLTAMDDLLEFPERAGANRPVTGRARDERRSAAAELDDPAVLVIGAGQAGLTAAARLTQLDVDVLVIEREKSIGDNWRKRYQSLQLHNQIWANQFPYVSFPSNWPVYLSKDEMAQWLATYADLMGLRVWMSTEIICARYEESAQRWRIDLRRADGTVHRLRPQHVVLAAGLFGEPHMPDIPGLGQFDGAIVHSSDYVNGDFATGKRALVVGSGSSAHDIAEDLYEHGARVTMLQRSSTCVVSVEPGAAKAYSIYNEDSASVDDCDLATNAFPLLLLAEVHKDLTRRIADMDRELLDGLDAAGFALDFGEDGSGFLLKYVRRGGGYYINTGCSDLIAAGQIAVKQGVEIVGAHGRTARFSDGSELTADIVVIATGYQNLSTTVSKIFGAQVAERVGPVWGLDDEGELRAMWRRTGQSGLWLMGGSLQQCRPYSKYLALQIKAHLEGLMTR